MAAMLRSNPLFFFGTDRFVDGEYNRTLVAIRAEVVAFLRNVLSIVKTTAETRQIFDRIRH